MNNVLRQVGRRAVPRSIRNWLRSPSRTLQWIGDGLAHTVGHHPRLELRPEWELVCHPAAFRILNAAQVHDPVQAAELAEFVTRCSPGMTLLDLGAHYGAFSLAAVHYGGPSTQVVAVDPSRWATKMLRAQAKLNGASDAMHIERAAVGPTVGTIRMLEVGVISDGYMVAGPEDDRPANEFSEVPMTTIDALCEERQVTPTHIKIDVEGTELGVLRCGRETLRQAHPALFIELHNAMIRDDGGDPTTTLATLEDLGYSEWLVEGRPVDRRVILGDDLVRIVAV